MKIVTFNIRLDRGWDGNNNFYFRKDHILNKIRIESPDIICFQEVLPHVARWLKGSLTDYYVVGCPRGENLDDEQTCIAFRPDRYELLKMDTYWLSPTPMLPGSLYEDQSCCPRICTEVTLREFTSGKVFRVANTHLDHEGQGARYKGMTQIIDKMEAETFFPGVPCILVGDMNAEPSSEEIRLITSRENWTDQTANIGFTFHGFGNCPPCQIDYILTHNTIKCTNIQKWTDCIDGVYLSDHYPVCAILEL